MSKSSFFLSFEFCKCTSLNFVLENVGFMIPRMRFHRARTALTTLLLGESSLGPTGCFCVCIYIYILHIIHNTTQCILYRLSDVQTTFRAAKLEYCLMKTSLMMSMSDVTRIGMCPSKYLLNLCFR